MIFCFSSVAVNIVDKVFFFGQPYYRSHLWYSVSSVCLSSVFCDILYCGKMYVLAKNCLKERIGNQSQKVDFLGSAPYFYFRFYLYGHRNGCFCLIFACTVQQLVLDGRNGLSSCKPCAYCRIMWSGLKPEVVIATTVDPQRCK